MSVPQLHEIVPHVPRGRPGSVSPPVKRQPLQHGRWPSWFAVGVPLALLIVALWGWTALARAAPVLRVDTLEQVALGPFVQVARDPTHRWTPTDPAAETPTFVDWTGGGFLAFGPTRDRVWLRLRVRNDSDHPTIWSLDLGEALLAAAVLYRSDRPGAAPPERITLSTPRAERAIALGRPVFRLETPARREQILWVGVETDFSRRLPLMAYGDRAFTSAVYGEGWFRGTWLGVMLLALVSNLFFWRIRRDPVYREVAGVVASVLAQRLILWGNWTFLFDAPSTRLVATLLFGASSLMLWFLLRATRQCLDLASHWPRVLPLYRVLERGCGLLFLLGLLAPNPHWLSPLIQVSGLIVSAAVILTLVRVWRRYPPTRLFASAYLMGLIGRSPMILYSLGVPGIPPIILTLADPLSLFLAMALLNLALADRIVLARRERDAARQRVKARRRMDLERLEQQVAERTQELARVSQHRDRTASLISHDLRGHVASLSFLAAAPNAPPVIANLHQQAVHLLGLVEAQRRRPQPGMTVNVVDSNP